MRRLASVICQFHACDLDFHENCDGSPLPHNRFPNRERLPRTGSPRGRTHNPCHAERVSVLPTEETKMPLARQAILAFLQSEEGPTAVEYAVMLALIIVVCISALMTLGSNANKTYTSAGKSLTASSS